MASKIEIISTINIYCRNFLDDVSLHSLKNSSVEEFEDFYSKLQFVAKSCSHLLNIDLTIFPDSNLNELSQSLVRLHGVYLEIERKTEKSRSAIDVTQLKNSLDNEYPQFFKHIQPFLSVTNANPLDTVNKLTLEIAAEHEKTLKNSQKVHESLEIIQGLLSAAETATEQLGIVKYGTIFRDEAKGYRTASRWWLAAFFLLTLTIIGLAITLLFFERDIENISNQVGAITTRIIVFASLFIAVSLCVKNYKVNRHNQIVCTHRQNALNTFETFVKTSNDDAAIKNAILLEVTRTIFNTHNTGYVSTDTDMDSPNRIVEIIKNITNSKA